PRLTLFPYTTLFRSRRDQCGIDRREAVGVQGNDVPQNVTLAVPRQVEIAVLREVDGRSPVRRGGVIEDQLVGARQGVRHRGAQRDRKSTRLNSSHLV